MRLRIGQIPYANLFPIFHVLRRDADCSRYSFTEGVPSLLNRMLREGEIDLSPSSSIEYLKNPGLYGVIGGNSISCRGAVRSILLLSKKPLEALNGGTIAVTSQSDTSVGLLRVIIERFLGMSCGLRVSGSPETEGADAFLLIGDDALKRWGREESGLTAFDLCEIWYRQTGLPFVFALWLYRRDSGKKELLERFTADLDRARETALRELPEIAALSPLRAHMTEEALVSYWRIIDYGLPEECRKGLELFRSCLASLLQPPLSR